MVARPDPGRNPSRRRALAPLLLIYAVLIVPGADGMTGTATATSTGSGTASTAATASPSTTPTCSSSQGLSRSQTLTQTVSTTGSSSHTSTLSQMQSTTPSESITETQSRSQTSTSSNSPSQSGTLSVTDSQSQTRIASPSQSASQAGTPSWSSTQTQSASESRTQSRSQSSTSSSSPSQSSTPSLTISQSKTHTTTPSQSPSQSLTKTASQVTTPSQAPSPSQTQSLTSSQSSSASQSPSQSQSPSLTPSQSGSLSQIKSPSSSATETGTESQTQTQTRTRSMTPSSTSTASGTPTVTATASQTHTASPTRSPSQSQTQTASLTASQSQTPSQTQSQSPSATLTPSQSQSRTPSQTSVPFTLTLQSVAVGVDLATLEPPTIDAGGGAAAATPVPLSDSTPPLAFTAWLNRCPDKWLNEGGVELVCAASYDDAASLIGAPAGSGGIYAVVKVAPGTPLVAPDSGGGSSAGVLFDLSPSCDAADARSRAGRGATGQQVLLPATIILAPAFRAATAPGSLACRVLGTGGSRLLADTTLPLAVSGTHWPLAADVVAITGRADALAQADRWRAASSQLGAPPNATAALASLANCGFVPTKAAGVVYGACAVAAVQSIWAGVPVPNRTAAAGATAVPFVLNATGTTLLVLHSDAPGAFTLGTTATIGGAPCSLAYVSPDGDWAALSTPAASALCGPSGVVNGSDGTTCGFNSFVLSTPADSAALAARLSCPPFCPGTLAVLAAQASAALTDPMIPLPLDTSGGNFTPGLASTVAAGNAAPLPDFQVAAAAPPGVYYEPSCVGTGPYTDPNSGSCTNESDSASFACAYGAGTNCKQCPSEAMCPGGIRLWPRAGYFAFSETDTSVQLCGPPDPTARCLGWDPIKLAQVCGPAYLQGSYLCGACASGHFPASDGSCAVCPPATSGWQRYRSLVLVLAALASLVATVYGLLLIVVKVKGGTIRASTSHAIDLGVWTVMTAQAVAQVASVTSRSLPPLLTSLFGAIAVLNLNGLVLPPACSETYAFTTEVLIMSVALVFASLTICVRLFVPVTAKQLQTLGRGFVTVALVTLPPAATHVFTLLYCVPTRLEATAIRVMDGGDAVLAAAGYTSNSTGLLTVNVLESNSFFVCWKGSHVLAGSMAAATLGLFVAGFPILLLLWVWWDPPLRESVAIERAEIERAKAETLNAGTRPRRAPLFVRCCVVCFSFCSRRRAMLSSTQPPQRSEETSPGNESPLTLTVANPLQQLKADRSLRRAKRLSHAGLRTAPLPSTVLLVPLLGNYRPLAWYTRFLDMALTVHLAGVQAFLRIPTTGQYVLLKTTLIGVPALLLCGFVLAVRPFLPGDAWKGWVRALLLALVVGCASISGASALLSLSVGGIVRDASLLAGLAGGTYALLCICILATVNLIVGVSRAIIGLAEIEQREIEEKKAMADAAAATAATQVNPMLSSFEGGRGERLSEAEEGRGERLDVGSSAELSASVLRSPEARESARFVSQSTQRRFDELRQKRKKRSASVLVASIATNGAAGKVNETVEACLELLLVAPLDLRPSRVKGVVGALTGLLLRPHDAAKGGAASVSGPAAVEAVCRALIAVSHAYPGAAAGYADVVAQAMAAHAASPAAIEQVCVLAGNATGDSRELARFLRAGGAGSIVGVMDAQLTLLGEQRGGPSPSEAASAGAAREHTDGDAAPLAALTQALVALCSVAGSSRGAAALVTAGAVPVVSKTLMRLADGDAAVAESGCLALSLLLRKAPGAANEALAACGGAAALLEQLRSPRAARDVDILAAAAAALQSAAECGPSDTANNVGDCAVTALDVDSALGTTVYPELGSEWLRGFSSEMEDLRVAHVGTPAEVPLSWLAKHGREVARLLRPLHVLPGRPLRV